MASDNPRESLNSRYVVKTPLGDFPPWHGYGVADSLSEREYLLFSLDLPSGTSLSIEDLRMRDYLFSRPGSIAQPALSIQQSNGSITFLLPRVELAPLTKVLPSMKPAKAAEVMRAIISYVLARLEEGLSFSKLDLASLAVVHDSPVILPLAYLLPVEVMRLIQPGSCSRGPGTGHPYGNLHDLGTILAAFAPYAGPANADRIGQLSGRLSSLAPETPGAKLRAALGEISSLAERTPAGNATLPAREFHVNLSSGPLKTLKHAAARSREGEKQVVIVTGKRGEGKTHFLDRCADALVNEGGFRRGAVAGDSALFQELPDREGSEPCDFALVDDRLQEPLLACHVIDYLCRAVDRCNLTVATVGEETPDLVAVLKEEFAKREITVRDIELPVPDAAEKRRILSQLAPPGSEGLIDEILRSNDSLALARLALIAALEQPAPGAGDGGARFLDTLSAEERSVLGFLAVLGFEAPLSFLLGIFAPEKNSVFSSLQKLAERGLVRTRTEVSALSGGDLCAVYRLSSTSLARAVLAAIPPERKESIHRNIAHLLGEMKNVPAAAIFYHLVRSGARDEAALKGLEMLQLFMKRKKLAALSSFNATFLDEHLDRALPVDSRYGLYLDLGNHYSLTGSTERAECFYRQCREEISREAEPALHRNLAVEAARRESEILEKKGEFFRAEKLLEKALEAHGENLLSSERAKLYNDMAWIHYRIGAFDRSWEHCLLVHKLLNEKQNPAEIAQAYNLMGTINWNRSNYDDAILCYKRCLALREECGDEMGIAATYNNLGLVYRSLGSLSEALGCFTKSMEMKKRHENLPGLAAAHLNLALVHLDMEKPRDAERCCVTAARLAETIGNQQLLAEAYGTMGEIFFLQGNYDKAAQFYAKDLQLCDKTKSLRERAVVYRKLAELDFALGKLPETMELLDRARALNQKIGSRLEMALLSLLEGRISRAQGRLADAKYKLEAASLELSLLGRKNAASGVAAEIGTVYLDEGNEPLARDYLLRALSLVAAGDRLPQQAQLLQEALDARSPLTRDQIATDSDRFRALCRLSSLLRTIREGEGLHAAVAETARKITGMDRAALVLRMEGKDSYRVLATSGGPVAGSILADRNVNAVIGMTRELGYAFDSTRTGIPEGKVTPGFLEEHPHVVCIPLRINDEPAGFLYLDGARGGARTSDEDHSFLVAFCQQAAVAMEKRFLVERIEELERPRLQPKLAPARPRERVTFQDIIGTSAPMRHIYDLIEGIKGRDTTVLLTGSNGTGKDLIAKSIHYGGDRADKPFVSLNCSAIPSELLESELFGHERGAFTGAHRQRIGHFESANGGTIFLNEIGDMPVQLQPKLLHVLEEQTFYRVGGTSTIRTNVRIIAATNKDLLALVKQGRFREDLYYRINIFPIRIPDLKERPEDIEPLAVHFLATFCRLYGIPVKKISPEAMALLVAYAWPGNVRELENLVNRLIIVSKKETILPEDLPDYVVKKPASVIAASRATLEETIAMLLENVELSTSDPILPKVEGIIVNKVVEKVGDKTKAASLLGISKPTVYSKLKKYGKNKDA